nr:DUF1997 domain-containing protein [Synechococcus sp. RSCCF101]
MPLPRPALQPRLQDGQSDNVRLYSSRFSDVMEMAAGTEQVGAYLDCHQGWFRRCAHPMGTEPIGANGYRLTLARFSNLGFEVQPTLALELLPQHSGTYRIVTLDSEPEHDGDSLYDIDFQASLSLDEESSRMTLVRWTLDLRVWIRLPAVLNLLPDRLVQSSGDHLLRHIVRSVSRSLTWKVQEDFHQTTGQPTPPRLNARF